MFLTKVDRAVIKGAAEKHTKAPNTKRFLLARPVPAKPEHIILSAGLLAPCKIYPRVCRLKNSRNPKEGRLYFISRFLNSGG